MALANPETRAALTLLSAKAVRERAHRMLAIGLDGKLPNFRIDLDRMDSVVDLVLDTTRNAYPSFDVPFHSRWRHFVSQWRRSLGCRRRPTPAGLTGQRVPAPNSTWPSSASSSMPAPVHRGATAIPAPDQPSAVRKDWGSPASPCSRTAPSRRHHPSLCAPMPTSSRILTLPISRAACRSRTSIRWSDWTAAPTCCVAWASWWPRSRTSSAAATRRGPAASTTGLRRWQRAASCPRRRS